MMNKEMAISILRGDVLGTNEQTHEAVWMAIKALKAEPVSRGKWIYKEYKGVGYFVCSECGHANWLKEDQYCSYCGSRMDLDEVNDEEERTAKLP